MKKYLLFTVVFLLISCAVKAPLGQYAYDNGNYSIVYNKYQLLITSNPSGAGIEINNQYIGKTPIIETIDGSMSLVNLLNVVATYTGCYQQTKTLGHPLPSHIHFEMGLKPTKNDYNINIKSY